MVRFQNTNQAHRNEGEHHGQHQIATGNASEPSSDRLDSIWGKVDLNTGPNRARCLRSIPPPVQEQSPKLGFGGAVGFVGR